jgi:hypothetical protein
MVLALLWGLGPVRLRLIGGEADLDVQAAIWAGVRGDVGAVGGGDGGDDGQAKPVPVAIAGPGSEPLEGLEQPAARSCRPYTAGTG